MFAQVHETIRGAAGHVRKATASQHRRIRARSTDPDRASKTGWHFTDVYTGHIL